MKIDSYTPLLAAAEDARVGAGSHLDPEELKHIQEVFKNDEGIPHDGDEDDSATTTELTHEEVKSHTDNALEDEANSSLYKGQHLPQ